MDAAGRQVLERTPGILRVWLAGLDDALLHCDTGPDTFSPYDVLGHLIEGERNDWLPRARLILQHGPAVPFPPFDRFAMWEWSQGMGLDTLLDEFARLRTRNLRELDELRLGPDDLLRQGTHPALGPVTLGQLLATWVVHDLNHLAQIARTMAFQHREAVGPWRAYLSVLPPGDC